MEAGRTNAEGGGGRRRDDTDEFPSTCEGAGEFPGRDGNLGGKLGRDPTWGTTGADRVDSRGALITSAASLSAALWAACTSPSFLDGGRGGNFAWSRAGARNLRVGWVSVDVVLVREDTGFNDRFEMVEICDTSDELDPLLLGKGWVDALRAGRAGDGRVEFLRPGRGGGASRIGRLGEFWEVGPDVFVRCGRLGTIGF